MKILLIAMPDASNNFHRMIRVPSLGLCSIAASLKRHDVRVFDLILVHKGLRAYLLEYLAGFRPDVVGISSMSFQYQSAREVMKIVRGFNPEIKIVLGGYHASMLYDDLGSDGFFDFIIRGEGELSFRLLIDAIGRNGGFSEVPGLSWRSDGRYIKNEAGPLLDLGALRKLRRASSGR